MFNTRIIFGTIATASLFAAAAAAPAMATTAGHPRTDHHKESVTKPSANPVNLGGLSLPGPVASLPGTLSSGLGASSIPSKLPGLLECLAASGADRGLIGGLVNGLLSPIPLVGNLTGLLLGNNGALGCVLAELGNSNHGGAMKPGAAVGGSLSNLLPNGLGNGSGSGHPGLGQLGSTVGAAVQGLAGTASNLPVAGGAVNGLSNVAKGALGGVAGALRGIVGSVPALGMPANSTATPGS